MAIVVARSKAASRLTEPSTKNASCKERAPARRTAVSPFRGAPGEGARPNVGRAVPAVSSRATPSLFVVVKTTAIAPAADPRCNAHASPERHVRCNAGAMHPSDVDTIRMGVTTRRARRLAIGALCAWFSILLVLGAGLLARHLIALPGPSKENALPGYVQALRGPDESGRWLAVHVLYAECRCSQRIVDHLTTTERPGGWSEIVLWVGDAAPPPELVARFRVRRVDEAELAGGDIEGAPLLVAADPWGSIRYAGGYTTRKQGPAIEDLALLTAARRTPLSSSLPVFGCAVSERLKAHLAKLPTP